MEQANTNSTSVRGKRRELTGTVISVAGQKSVVVQVSRRYMHKTYRKFITRLTKYMAHDERSGCAVGDTVQIEECRPLSAMKRWRVVKTVTKAEAV